MKSLQSIMAWIFDDYNFIEGVCKGGQGKYNICNTPHAALGTHSAVTDNEPLTAWILVMLEASKHGTYTLWTKRTETTRLTLDLPTRNVVPITMMFRSILHPAHQLSPLNPL
jgi:hypothetical protein